MAPALYPMVLARRFSPKLWGGDRLRTFLADLDPADLPDTDEPIGESWEVYAGSEVRNGAWRGRTLQEVADGLGEALLGTESVRRYGLQVPLLSKFLDTAQDLSIQVHPDDAFARAHEAESGHLGKTEAWLVLEADPGAGVLWTFRREVAEAEVRAAIEEERLEALLQRVPVGPGSVIVNPAGTVHAVGAGILLFEIQQSSDLTYRLYDFGRRGADGRPRDLHLDRALAVAALRPGGRPAEPPVDVGGGWRRLVSDDAFTLDRGVVEGVRHETTRPSSLVLLTSIAGEAEVGAAGTAVRLRRGGSVVLPAALGAYTLRADVGAEVVRCALPEAG